MKDFSGLAAAEATNRVKEAPAFATRAQAGLLDALGWEIVASPRREVERHAPLQCCFVLRDGTREEAAFGYTGISLPGGDSRLARAQAQVVAFLDRLGEGRGVLLQNRPLVSFGRHSAGRIAVFGGWRYEAGQWAPFLLGPGGLSGVAAQAGLFASATRPDHLAEVCGHPADTVLPKLAALAEAVESIATGAPPSPDEPGLELVPCGKGWSVALPGAALPSVPVSRLRRGPAVPAPERPAATPVPPAVPDPAWDPEADAFRFNLASVDRR